MRAREFIFESFIVESYPLARNEFIRAATAKFGPEAVAKIGTKDEPKEITKEIDNVKQLLDKHRELAKKNQFRNPEEKDINHWRSQGWDAFSQMIKLKSSNITDTQRKRGKVVGNAIMLRDDSEWKILIPLDKEASVYYGKGTKWCTTRPYDSYYESYVYDKKGTLIYAIDQVGYGKRSVAILIKKGGSIELFNKKDDPIDDVEYTKVSGLDPYKYIEMTYLPGNKTQIEESREIYNTAKEETKTLSTATPLNVDALEVSLKITKNHADCYKFIETYSTEQNKRVTVHPIILAAAAAYVSGKDYESKRYATDLGKHIDFSKIPNATIKTALRLSPELFIYNYELLSKEQRSLLTSSPKSAFMYVVEIRKRERVPELEHIIAQDAKSAVDYASQVLKNTRFPAGEAAIATDAQASHDYSRYVLKGKRFPAGESAIANDPKLAVQYVENVLHGPFPEAESEILENNHLAIRYGQALSGILSPSWERLIKDDTHLIMAYVNGVKKRVPALEPKIAEQAHYAFEYAQIFNKRFPAGEPAIAQYSDYSYYYATTILKKPFPAGEEAIKSNSSLWPKYQQFLSTVAPVVNRDNSNQQVASSDAFSILPPDAVKTTEYFMAAHNDDPEGPFSSVNVLRLMKMHHMQPDRKLIWRKGLNNWVTLADMLPELDPTNYKQKNRPSPLHSDIPPPPVDVTAPANINYYILNDKEKTGPYSIRDVFNRISTPEITKDSKVWKPGMTNWQPFSAIKDDLLNAVMNR